MCLKYLFNIVKWEKSRNSRHAFSFGKEMQWMLSMKRGVVLFSFLFGEKTEKTALNWCHSFSSWNSSLSWDQLSQGFFCSQTDTKLSWDQCLGLCWREAGGNGSYQNSGRCMCSWVSCGLVSGSGTLHTFAHVHDSMHAHTCTCEADTHTHTQTVGILLPPPRAPEPDSLDMEDIREWERHENTDSGSELDQCVAVKVHL